LDSDQEIQRFGHLLRTYECLSTDGGFAYSNYFVRSSTVVHWTIRTLVYLLRHREIRRQMSHSQAIQGLTLKPDMLVDDNDINDREVGCNESNKLIVHCSLETRCGKIKLHR
jgi:hypothetical protein